MAIDTSIYNNLLRPPKSVADYDKEAVEGQQNRLALMLDQQKVGEYQRSMQDSAALRGVVSGFGTDTAENQQSLLRAGRLKEAQDYGKSVSDLGETKAKADEAAARAKKVELESINLASEQHRTALNTINDPQQAAAWVTSLYSDPRLAPITSYSGTLDQALGRIPTDPAKFQEWKMQSQLGAEQLIKQTRPDANSMLTATTSRDNSIRSAASSKYSADSSAATARARLAFDKEKNSDDATALSDATKQRIAQQFVDAGDISGLKNLGRGTQGAKDLRGIQNAITEYAAKKGMAPAEISAKIADFDGLKVGLRTSANISARVENAVAEAQELAPLAVAASQKVARSGFLPFGRMQVMFNNQTNDPDMNRFATANIGLATAYAGAMARGQKPTVHDKEHAEKVIGEAKSQAAYEAVVDQLLIEMAAAQRAPHKVRDSLRNEISGKGGTHASPGGPATTAAKPSLSDIFGK